MVKYLIILLDDTSVSFCHYQNNNTERNLIRLGTLIAAVKFAYLENLSIQFVFPDYTLPEKYMAYINTVDGVKVAPVSSSTDAEVYVIDGFGQLNDEIQIDKSYILRTSIKDFFTYHEALLSIKFLPKRLSIVFSDVEDFNDEDILRYNEVLKKFIPYLKDKYINGETPQLSILTDRMMLSKMNNCGAGDESITVAPNGNFYVCPAFFQNGNSSIGNIHDGLSIPNGELFKLKTSPLCRNCDAYNCKRCIWLNKKLTNEVCIPSHQQCVISHIERNCSRCFRDTLLAENCQYVFSDIPFIDYLDPFDNRNNFK